MGRMEIITHTERRRRHSEATKAAILADADAPGSTVRVVAKRHGVAESLIYHWRSVRRKTASIASEPMQFIEYGAVTDAVTSISVAAASPIAPTSAPKRARAGAAMSDELVRPHPGLRPGAIDIGLTSGVRLSVDSYVNEKALSRVLRALREASC